MTATQKMLETHPRVFNVDRQLLARTIDAVVDCANTCTNCADACLGEDEPHKMVKCVRLNLDCADVCTATARVLSRQTEYDANVTRAQVQACIAACRACGDECAMHGENGMEHCATCAEHCRRCEQACEELLAAIG